LVESKKAAAGVPAIDTAMHRAGEKISVSVDGQPSSHVSFQS